MTVNKKVVLITGCSQGGIGAALCEEYAEQGCIVYATARRLESMEFKHKDINKIRLDVTSDEDVQRAVKTIIDDQGRIDVLVNNAGVNCAGALIDVSMDTLAKTYDANTFAVIRTSKAVFPYMAARKSGEIVNIGSIGGDIPTAWNGAYSSSKAALRGISDVLWQEFKPFNLSVTHVTAGGVISNIAKKAIESGVYMPEDSLYKPYMPLIIKRVWASQSPNSLPAEEFSKTIVSASLAPSPPRHITLGNMSFVWWLMSWFPRTWALNLLWSRFSDISAK